MGAARSTSRRGKTTMTTPQSTARGADRENEERITRAVNQTAPDEPKPDIATRLAIERTRVAYDRTMMAWVRTSTSLITFGFTIYKFFQLQRYGDLEPRHRIGPRVFGLILVSIGIVSLILAAWDNKQNMESLRSRYPDVPYSRATALGALIFLLGVTGLVLIILRK